MKRSSLENLAGFLDRVSVPEFVAGDWVVPEAEPSGIGHFPFVHFNAVAVEFIEAAYANRWLESGFDWGDWSTSEEATRLVTDLGALANASPKQLSKLLTLCIRRDKFCEGSLLNDFKSGLVRRIVQRAADIITELDRTASLPKKLSNQQAGGLGEMLALAKLNSLGVAAYMSPEGAPGHDIIAIVDGTAKSIEVKTRQFILSRSEITRWPVNLETKGDADFFLFVELDLSRISPTFYLLTNQQARETNKSAGNGQGNCYPAHVRKLVKEGDFSALLGGSALQLGG